MVCARLLFMGIGRKMSEISGSPQGAAQNIAGVASLFSGINSQKSVDESPDLVKEPILALDIEDDELLKLTSQWNSEYDNYYSPIKNRQEDNYKYWEGKQHGSVGTSSRGTDNIVFESVETLLPIICRQSPEPTVEAENTDEGTFISESTATILRKKADETKLKSKLKTVARNWSLDFLGCMKMGWDEKTNDMYFQMIDPKKIKLDPKGYFDGGEFIGRFIGEEKFATADDLSREFPDAKDVISAFVGGKMGTMIPYMEWWTDTMLFWQFKGIILDKRKNPYWNGDVEEQTMDENGVEGMQTRRGVNHFASPKRPYAFLSVFNTGKQPHDETNLVEQVKNLQDIINKRLRQIDKNADETNNGIVLNKEFSQDEGKQASDAIKNGGTIIAPVDDVRAAAMRLQAPQLAPFVFQDMLDKREQVYNIMGVRGSTAQGVISEQTVRGKIQLKGQDIDRLSLIVEQIEQMVDHLYNLAVQTIYVFYTPENVLRYLGPEDSQRYLMMLQNGPSRRMVVSVKEGSTVPQDSLTKRNEAIDLWQAQAIDPESFFEKLDFADPKDSAKKLMQFRLDPQGYLAELGGMPPTMPGMEMGQGQQQMPPSMPGAPETPPPSVQPEIPPIPSA